MNGSARILLTKLIDAKICMLVFVGAHVPRDRKHCGADREDGHLMVRGGYGCDYRPSAT